MGWSSTEVFGTIVLSEKADKPEEKPEKKPEEKPEEKPETKPSKVVEQNKPAKVPAGLTLKYNGKEQTGVAEGDGYTLTGNKGRNAGSYTAVATLKNGYKWDDGSSSEKKIKWKITKTANTLKATAKTAKVSFEELQGKSVKLSASKAVKVKGAKGKVRYKKISGNKNIKIDKKTGKITVRKGLEKGVYKVKVEVKAAGDSNHKGLSRKVTFKVKVN